MAVVASLSSVVWFIKSYNTTSAQKHLKEEHYDGSESSSSPSSICFDEGLQHLGSEMSGRLPRNLDTRSELEVELDFEFSEERNCGISTNPTSSTLNSNTFHVQLDSLWSQHPSVSQA